MDKNSMIGWLYRAIDLSQITSAVWRVPVRPSESFDWVLHRVQMEYDSDEEDPSQFDLIQWRLAFPQQERAIQDIADYKPRPLISLSCSSGIHDITAGTTRPKQIYFPSPRIDWPIQSLESFSLELENFTGLTGIVRVLFIGSFILPANPIMQASEAYE